MPRVHPMALRQPYFQTCFRRTKYTAMAISKTAQNTPYARGIAVNSPDPKSDKPLCGASSCRASQMPCKAYPTIRMAAYRVPTMPKTENAMTAINSTLHEDAFAKKATQAR